MIESTYYVTVVYTRLNNEQVLSFPVRACLTQQSTVKKARSKRELLLQRDLIYDAVCICLL